jgi:leucyl aminopeptidase
LQSAETALAEGLAIAAGMELAKDLGNLPGNICTPSHLADQAKEIAKSHGLGVDILDRADMEKLGMNTLLSVARGSHEPPKFIVLRYTAEPQGRNRWFWWAKGSPSIPAAFRSSRDRKWMK